MSELGAAIERITTKVMQLEMKNGENRTSRDLKMILKTAKKSIGETQDSPDRKQDAIVFYQNNIGMIRPMVTEEMLDWINDYGDEMVIEAIKRAVEQNKPSWGYARGILQSWQNKNIKTLEEVNAEDVEFQNRKSQKTPFYQNQKNGIVPDWFENREHEKKQPEEENEPRNQDARKQVEELLKKYKD